MEIYYSFSILIVIATIFSYINKVYLKLPATIGVMIIAMIFSVFMVMFGTIVFSPKIVNGLRSLVENLDFTQILMGAMLNFLLFAGGIHINISDLREQKAPIAIFSTVSVIISSLLVGCLIFYILPLINIQMPFIYCLLFGTLIAPTDPIAVLGVLKEAKVSKELETKVAGESLFNDGIAVVMFAIVLQMTTSTQTNLTLMSVSWLLVKEAGGGILLGLGLGMLGAKYMRKADDYKIAVMVTLSVVMGGYLIAHSLHFSGPLTMVCAGLLIGNIKQHGTEKPIVQDYLHKFWELLDEILNAILFLFIGFELLIIPNLDKYFVAGGIAILIVLFARYVSIFVPSKIVPFKKKFTNHTIKVLTWGGIRGGVSIALALSIPENQYKYKIVAITYIVVVFSIIVQGLTIGKLAKKGAKFEYGEEGESKELSLDVASSEMQQLEKE